jgi:ABC-type transporter Mla MlaB component
MLALARAENGTWHLSGQVTVDTITDVLPQLEAMIASDDKSLVVDLSQVTRVDSGSIALLLEGKRLAMKASKTLQFTQYPQKMLDIIHVSNLDKLLL